MNSIWTDGIKPTRFDRLDGTVRCDVLIVGGGMAGVLCAHRLSRAGVDCVLVEAGRIGGGITKNTTAKITAQTGLIYDKLMRRHGEDRAWLYLQAQIKAGEEYARLCREIPCDYEHRDSYVYSMTDRRKIEREVAALEHLGAAAEFSHARELPMRVSGAVKMREQAQFHPLKFLYGVARGLRIYENTKVTELRPYLAKTEQGEIVCKSMIVATHFPILNKHGSYFLKLYQHRSYVLALEGAKSLDGMYVDESDTGLSFRSYKDCLLLGGGAHRTGKMGGGWAELRDFAGTHYHGARVAYEWATQDCMSLDRVPYIGRYSKGTTDLYVATGFNKWGMSGAMVSSMILTDLICGRENPYAEVFSPSRPMLSEQLACNVFESLVGLLTPTVPRCPHLGCALKYNRAEHSWDCPCHGSRFTKEGELIDNPATHDKKKMH